jgi:phenylalanyl-tRNA synthetase beta chain
MPKIEVAEKMFFSMLGKKLPKQELIDVLESAKAELDEWDTDKGILKIELNDTNRPDLWSCAGLARQLKFAYGGKIKSYDFFSKQGAIKESGDRVIKVDPNLKNIRPYIVAFAVKGKPIDEPFLIDLIQTQEKVCWNFGQKRKGIAMGVYRADLVKYPVSYKAADPATTKFTPLGFTRPLSLKEILKEHPKGAEFGWIVENFPRFPYLEDAKGECLSFPPIINSATLGALEVGDKELFIELTGNDLDNLLIAASLVACDLADFGYEILPVKVQYPYDTPHGREVTAPFYFQKEIGLDLDYACKLLGEDMSGEKAREAIARAGNDVRLEGKKLVIAPAPYRNDFLHPVDVMEEIMIGRGLGSFSPLMPKEYTIGRLSKAELFMRSAREIMVGLGFQEMIYNYLGSKKDFIEKMNLPDEGFIHIANPMTENYAVVRKSAFPSLLGSEASSGNAVYPHKIFEIGKVIYRDDADNYGSLTRNYLSILLADKVAGFNDIYPSIAVVFYYLSKEYTLKEVKDPRFIDGRVAQILCNGKVAGIMGEVHPSVLKNYGVEVPCSACEIDLDTLLEGGA